MNRKTICRNHCVFKNLYNQKCFGSFKLEEEQIKKCPCKTCIVNIVCKDPHLCKNFDEFLNKIKERLSLDLLHEEIGRKL